MSTVIHERNPICLRLKLRLKLVLKYLVLNLILCFVAQLSLAGSVGAADNKVAQPVLGLFTISAFPIGNNADAPRFVLYSDGTVIFRDAAATTDDAPFLTVKLTDAEKKQVLAQLAKLSTVEERYEISRVTCQPMNILGIHTPTLRKSIRVNGSILYPNSKKDPDTRDKLPPAVLAMYEQFGHYKHKSAKPWLPEYIQVSFRPFAPSAKEETVAWPADWPDINDERTQKSGESFNVLLPISKFDALKALKKTDHQVVLMHGKTWLTTYRMPFPQESAFESLKHL